jgi:hypothetical protein
MPQTQFQPLHSRTSSRLNSARFYLTGAKKREVLSHSPVTIAASLRELSEYRQHIMTDMARFFLGSLGYFLLIVLPVLFYLKWRAQTNIRIVLYTFALWFLWYLPYAPLHEGCHFLAGALAGLHVKSYQLIPRFWRGDFVHGYVSWEEGKPWQLLLSCQAPYSVDGLIILLGLFLFRWRTAFTPFVGALILTQTFLRSVYDVAVNYAADTILGGSGDFRFLFGGYPRLAVYICAWALMLMGAFAAWREIAKARPGKTMNSTELERPRK